MHKQTIYHQKNYGKEFEEDRYGGSFGRFLYDLEVEAFLSLIEESHKRILDVGAGTGKLCIPLLSQSREVVAVDFSQDMIKFAKMNAERKRGEIITIVCDAEQLCFNDNSFDCVVSSRLLMHLTDWRKGIAELCRVSRAVVIVDLPPRLSFAGLGSLFKIFKHFFISGTQTYKTFFIKNVVGEFKRNRFQVVTINKQFFLPIAFHRWLNRPWLSGKIEKLFRIIGMTRIMGAPITVKAVRERYLCYKS